MYSRLLHGAIHLCCIVMFIALWFSRSVSCTLCLTSHIMLCIASFLSLPPIWNVWCVVLRILRHVLCCVFDPSCSCKVAVPRFCAIACLYISFSRCVGNSVLGLPFKWRPIYYHLMFSNIRLIYSNQETTN